jgi:DNA-binding transcriptional ArsR family regulator
MVQMDKHSSGGGVGGRGTPRFAGAAEAMVAVEELDELYDPAWFRALAEPRRFGVLSCLVKCGRACTVSEVASCCDVDFSVVARHLSALEAAGLVGKEKRGRSVWYRAHHEAIAAWGRAFAEAVERWETAGDGGVDCGVGGCAPACGDGACNAERSSAGRNE